MEIAPIETLAPTASERARSNSCGKSLQRP